MTVKILLIEKKKNISEKNYKKIGLLNWKQIYK